MKPTDESQGAGPSKEDAAASSSSEALAEIMLAGLSKNPTLADKQRRLLRVLQDGTSAALTADSPPKPESFGTQEEFEEAQQRWRETVGRNKAFADLASKRSPKK